LDSASFSTIIGANQYGWVRQLNALALAETLEILDFKIVKHSHERRSRLLLFGLFSEE
jgi:hypothetical protein